MKRFLNMTIATPEGVIFEGEVESAAFPGGFVEVKQDIVSVCVEQ